MLAFLLVEKRDPNLLYKYSKNEQRHPVACGAWAAQTQGAELGEERSRLQGSLRAAVLGIPGGAGPSHDRELSV